MNQDKRTVIVGIFILIGLAILVSAIIFLGGKEKVFDKAVIVSVDFENVQGLSKGNNVWFSGVKVGTVRSVSFAGENLVRVELKIDRKIKDHIKKDSKASIGADGFIGDKIVFISPGSPNSPSIEDGDMLMADSGLGLDQLLATLQKNNNNLLSITDNFKKISDKIAAGEGSIGKLLNDNETYDDIRAVMENLKATTAKAEEVSKKLNSFVDQLNHEGGFAHSLANDTVIFSNLKTSSQSIQQLSREAASVIDDLKKASTTLNKGLEDVNSPAGVLLNDKEAAENLSEILKNLESGSKKLDENLEALRHNFLFRRYFKKQEKEKHQQ